MKVLEAGFVQGFIRMCNDGWEQGWHERNGGNLTYRIKKEEAEAVQEELRKDGEWREIGTSVPLLSGEYFLRRLRNAKSRINTAFFCCQNKMSPQGLW